MQKVNMSGDSQDMVADLLHEITGTDAEEVLFSAEEQMNDLGVALQHSAEAKFLLRALLEMRFRRDHAQQACAFVFAEHAGSLAGKDTLLIGALDWLCLHVDDKHLPRQFASVSRIEVVNSGQPKSSVVAVALAEEGDSISEGKASNVATIQAAADLSAVEQQQIFRLMSFGFSRKKIAEALREQAQDREMADEDETLGLLLAGILQRRRGAKVAAADKERQAELEAFIPPREELAEMWEEEQEALAGIFDDDFAKVGRARCEIVLRCTLGEAAAGHAVNPAVDGSATVDDIVAAEQEVRMVVVVPADSKYPAEPPLVGFLCSALLPKTCLEVTKRLLGEAATRVRTNLEEYEAPAPVLWELSSWLEEELPRILELVMPGQILFGDDDAEPEPELEPEFRGVKTKYDRR
jgi:Holliday junction resolvasome RuvABC DNA-binding subunit